MTTIRPNFSLPILKKVGREVSYTVGEKLEKHLVPLVSFRVLNTVQRKENETRTNK